MTPRTQGIFLRTLRTAIAIVAWSILTWVSVDGIVSSDSLPDIAAWLERVQFLPAAMAFSLSTVIGWVLVTLVFGRVYCSTICPLGTWQDACSRLRRLSPDSRRRYRYRYSRPLPAWRNATLALYVAGIFLGIYAVILLLDPWHIYSDALEILPRTVYNYIVSLLDDTAFRIAAASAAGAIVSAVLIGGISIVAFRNGRTFCNTICPVGTALGYVSRYSLLHIEIDTDLCTHCGRCEDACKASCINLNDHVADGSRCVACFDCMTACHDDAIRYTISRKTLSTPLMQRTSSGPLKSPQAAG